MKWNENEHELEYNGFFFVSFSFFFHFILLVIFYEWRFLDHEFFFANKTKDCPQEMNITARVLKKTGKFFSKYIFVHLFWLFCFFLFSCSITRAVSVSCKQDANTWFIFLDNFFCFCFCFKYCARELTKYSGTSITSEQIVPTKMKWSKQSELFLIRTKNKILLLYKSFWILINKQKKFYQFFFPNLKI